MSGGSQSLSVSQSLSGGGRPRVVLCVVRALSFYSRLLSEIVLYFTRKQAGRQGPFWHLANKRNSVRTSACSNETTFLLELELCVSAFFSKIFERYTTIAAATAAHLEAIAGDGGNPLIIIFPKKKKFSKNQKKKKPTIILLRAIHLVHYYEQNFLLRGLSWTQ